MPEAVDWEWLGTWLRYSTFGTSSCALDLIQSSELLFLQEYSLLAFWDVEHLISTLLQYSDANCEHR